MARRSRRSLASGEDLPPFGKDGKILHAIVDTPKGSRNKFKWDGELKLYKLAGVLPAGAVFPFDFGYVPSTAGEDGDALDVLLLMDEPAFVGCLVEARLIGVITETCGSVAFVASKRPPRPTSTTATAHPCAAK